MGENKLYCMRCFEAMEDGSNTCPHCGWHNGEQVKNALPYGTLLGEKYLVGQAVHVNGAGITYAALEAKTAQKVEVREFIRIPSLCAARPARPCCRSAGQNSSSATI